VLQIGFLCFFLCQYSLTMGPEERVFSLPADILEYIIRFTIAGQAHSDDLTEDGHYVCTDFIKYKDDLNRPIIPWITKLFFINKTFYKISSFILEQYHKKPDQINNLVDFFCTHFQGSINKQGQEELPISTYFSKYLLNQNCVDYTTIFYKALCTVTAFKTCKSLEKYQKDFSSFFQQYEKYIDFDACSIKFSKKFSKLAENKLERRYLMDQQFLSCYVYLPEDIVEYYLTKVKEHVSGQKSNLPCVYLNSCIVVSNGIIPVIEHLPKKCAKIISFLGKIFSCSELKNLQKSIHNHIMCNITNALICDNVKHFIQKEFKMYYHAKDISDLSSDKQMCATKNECSVLLDTLKIDMYVAGEISFEQLTLNVKF